MRWTHRLRGAGAIPAVVIGIFGRPCRIAFYKKTLDSDPAS